MEAIINYSLTIVTFVLGIVVSYYFYKKSIKKKEPVYSIKSNNLIAGTSSMIENLTVLYADMPVENLTASKIIFFNNGEETITTNDLKTKNPLRITPLVGYIIDIRSLHKNTDASSVMLTRHENKKSLIIEFDYLDKSQGMVLQVIHTGLRAEDLVVEGSIMGVQDIKRINPDKFQAPRKSRFVLLKLVLQFLVVILSTVSLFRSMVTMGTNWFLVLFSAFVAYYFIELVISFYVSVRGKALPKGLETFNE